MRIIRLDTERWRMGLSIKQAKLDRPSTPEPKPGKGDDRSKNAMELAFMEAQ